MISLNTIAKPSPPHLRPKKPLRRPPKILAAAAPIRAFLQYNRKPELSGETPRVVVITSGKGGVGKTTTTANIGLSLARLGFSAVAIDADVGLRNLDLLLGLENRVNYTVVEVLNGDCRLDQALVRDKRWSNFELLCISKPRSKLPLGFGGKALIWLVDALKNRQEGPPDFILIDCPAGIDAGFITAITPANEAVLVTTPDITSLRDADRVTGLLECDGIRDIKMIVNRVRTDMIKGEDMMSVLDVQEMLGLPLLGVIPEDSEVIRSTNRGYPLVLNKPPALAGLAFEQAAWRLVEQDTMKAVMVEEEPKKKGFFSFFGGNSEEKCCNETPSQGGKHKFVVCSILILVETILILAETLNSSSYMTHDSKVESGSRFEDLIVTKLDMEALHFPYRA
ncbi:Putative septum site-determining protein minD homolog- chloroplastic [Striga hermonthica]|uniref:Septum site-determining protein minD homolog- chloroplastic n=1 Tax=Striga hermonthica TaxID=68872 RepID=A0A9N7NBJ5_STRHE|nr:Putative septum site-determining protein minD homolog- chloroplastic [Striga hermonthica]